MPLIGDATVRIGADDSRLRRGLDSAGKYTTAKFAAIGAAAAGAFAAAFSIEKLKEVVTAGKDIKVFADQAGVSAEAFQRLNTAIEKANGDTSDTVSIMLDLKRAMADARTGKKEWVDRFALFGVTIDQIKKDDPVALFESLGRAVAKTTELTGEQVDALGKMMGEDTSARAIAAFRNNFIETMQTAIVLTQKTVNGLKEIDDAFKSLGKQGMADFAKIIVDNKDVILEITRELGKTFKVGVEFFDELRKMVESAKNAIPDFSTSSGTGAGMSMADIQRMSDVRDFTSKNKRQIEVRNMFRAAEFAPDKVRREELRSAFQLAQKESLEVLKQIRDKTGSSASTDAVIMGGL